MTNKASVANRTAAIREHLTRLTAADATLFYPYASGVAARWESLRLLADRVGRRRLTMRFRELSAVLRGLTDRLGLQTCTGEKHGPDGIPGLTIWTGHLPLDLGDLIGLSWQESASGW